MIKIEHTDVVGWEAAIRGMRNPMNSWNKGDSYYTDHRTSVGKNDLDLMKRLAKAGTDHRKFMRMVVVYADITAPLYWWKEYDTYKVGTVANSCSTMHKIHDKEFTLDDFSCEHLADWKELEDSYAYDPIDDYVPIYPKDALKWIVDLLNVNRLQFIRTKDKGYWWQMIQLLPSSYNQKRTVMLNYEVLANMYHSRKAHKLDEWKEMCKWIESLPYSELITDKAGDGNV
jgi:hypothetical protein